jgi:hypothetical protein
MMGERLDMLGILIVTGCLLGFCDESIRKVVPGNPVEVTAVKDVVLAAAGTVVLATRGARVYRQVLAFAPWVVLAFVSILRAYAATGSPALALASCRTYCVGPLLFAVGYHVGSKRRLGDAVIRILAIAGVVAVLVGLLQEFVRDVLPPIFSERIYFGCRRSVESHQGVM